MVPESKQVMERKSVVENKPMHCVGNNAEGDRTFQFNALNDDRFRRESEDVEVDIIECANSGDNVLVEDRLDDSTESMSSFGASDLDNDDGLDDPEVESQLRVHDVPVLGLDEGYRRVFPLRRKRVTGHWRQFIRPNMWRFKRIILLLKELNSQARKYKKELVEYEKRKQFDFETDMVDNHCAKLLPFTSYLQREVMKRKKRIRLEETTDLKSYVSQHNLFAYFENRKNINAINSVSYGVRRNIDANTNGVNLLGLPGGWTSPEPSPRDNFQEDMFRKIEVLHLQARSLKARIDKVVKENPEKFSSINMLSVPAQCNDLVSSDQVLASPPENGVTTPIRLLVTLPQPTSEFDRGDVLPDCAVSSHGEMIPSHETVDTPGQPQDGYCPVEKEQMQKQSYKDFGTELAELLRAPMMVKSSVDSEKYVEMQTVMASQNDDQMQAIKALETDLPQELVAARVQQGCKPLPRTKPSVFYSRKRTRRS